MRHGPHQAAQTSTRTGMVLRAIWRSKICAATSSGCPANILALHFPHLASMPGRDNGKRLIVPHLLQTTRFSVMLLSSASTPLPLDAFDDDWRVQECRLNSNQALAALAERGYEMRCVGERRDAVRRNPITSPLSERVRQGATPPPRRRQDREIPAVSCPLHMLRRRVAAQTSALSRPYCNIRCRPMSGVGHQLLSAMRHVSWSPPGPTVAGIIADKTCPGEPDGGRNDKHH